MSLLCQGCPWLLKMKVFTLVSDSSKWWIQFQEDVQNTCCRWHIFNNHLMISDLVNSRNFPDFLIPTSLIAHTHSSAQLLSLSTCQSRVVTLIQHAQNWRMTPPPLFYRPKVSPHLESFRLNWTYESWSYELFNDQIETKDG